MIDGVAHGRIWHFRDVTEERRHERAIRHSEEQLLEAERAARVAAQLGPAGEDPAHPQVQLPPPVLDQPGEMPVRGSYQVNGPPSAQYCV